MVRIAATALLAFAMTVLALTPDPNGAKNVGLGNGSQFITGECKNNADCASACCATTDNVTGICSGPGAAFQNGKQGCGFAAAGAGGNAGNAGGNTNGAGAPAAGCQGQVVKRLTPDPNGAKNVGLGNGSQFITGECKNNADCASACCATTDNVTGICSGPGAAFQNGKQGCGFAAAGAGGNTNGAGAPAAGCQGQVVQRSRIYRA